MLDQKNQFDLKIKIGLKNKKLIKNILIIFNGRKLILPTIFCDKSYCLSGYCLILD